MKAKKIYACWVYVSNLQKSKNFYQSLGFEIKFIDKDWIEFDFGETSFAILERPINKGKVVPQKTRIMFETDNIKSLYQELNSKKIKLIGNIRNETYGKLLTFEDPDGNWLEFFQNKS